MTRYYCCINNNDGHSGGSPWPGLPSGSWTRVTYGAGGDLSADINDGSTGLLKLRNDLSAAILDDLDAGNRDSRLAICLDAMVNWSYSDPNYTARVYAFAPLVNTPGNKLSRTDRNGAYGASIEGDSGFNPPVLPDETGTSDQVTFSKATYDAAVAKVDVIVSRSVDSNAGAYQGVNRARTLGTMQFSDDCMHVMWDSAPTYLTDVSLTSFDGSSHWLFDWAVWSSDAYYALDFYTKVGGTWACLNRGHNFTPTYDTGDGTTVQDARVHLVRAADGQTLAQYKPTLPSVGAPTLASISAGQFVGVSPTTYTYISGVASTSGNMTGYDIRIWYSTQSDGSDPRFVVDLDVGGGTMYHTPIWVVTNDCSQGAGTAYGTWYGQILRLADDTLVGDVIGSALETVTGYKCSEY